MKKLSQSLLGLNHPILDEDKKNQIKASLMSQLEVPASEVELSSYRKIIQAIRVAVSDLKMEASKKANIKEHLFEMIEQRSSRPFWSGLFVFNKKMLSATLAFVLFFGFFGFVNVNTNTVVRASTFTSLASFEGGVLVSRDGEFVSPYEGMQLVEDDQIITGDDGSAVIQYFDDSLSRLASNTKIIVDSLESQYGGPLVNGNVEIVILSGSAWFKVVNLVGGNSFIVRTKDTSTTTKKAAFNVKVDDERLEIGVFKNSVEITSSTGVEKIIKGNKLLVEKGEQKIHVIDQAELDNDQWVQGNLENDKQYITDMEKKLLLAKAKAVGIEVNDDFSLENSLREDTLLLLTFDDVKKKKIEFELAEKKFIAAQVKLYDPDLSGDQKGEAELAISGFYDAVDDFYSLIKEVSYTDKKYSADLELYLDTKLLAHKKDLSVSLPDSPSYKAKKVIDKLELLAADGKEETLEIKFKQSEAKLADAEEVKDKGDLDLASEVLTEYKQDVGDVIQLLGDVKGSELKEKLVSDVNKDIELLGSIDGQSNEDVLKLKSGVAKISGTETLDLALPTDPVIPNTPNVGLESPKEPVITEGEFGVKIQGDKPLSPLF